MRSPWELTVPWLPEWKVWREGTRGQGVVRSDKESIVLFCPPVKKGDVHSHFLFCFLFVCLFVFNTIVVHFVLESLGSYVTVLIACVWYTWSPVCWWLFHRAMYLHVSETYLLGADHTSCDDHVTQSIWYSAYLQPVACASPTSGMCINCSISSNRGLLRIEAGLV